MVEDQLAHVVQKASKSNKKLTPKSAIMKDRNSQLVVEHQRLDKCEGAPLVLELPQAD